MNKKEWDRRVVDNGQETNRNFGCSKEFGMYGPSSFGLLHFGKSFWTREMLWMC